MSPHQTRIEVRCDDCDKDVKAWVICDYLTETSQEDPILVSFLKCPSCDGPMIVWQDAGGGGWSEPYRMYPPEEYEIFFGFPEEIRFSMIEAYQCLKNGTYTASVVMCRKVLEGICHKKKVRKGNLKTKLNKLKDKGYIDEQLLEWAQTLRLTGNDAAHVVLVKFTKEDAQDSLDFARALADYIFNLREKFEKYKKRQARRKAT